IEPRTDKFGLFDFRNPDPVIQAGYEAAKARLKEIEMYVQRRTSKEELKERRENFRSGRNEIFIDKVEVRGINEKQAEYVKKIIKPKDEPLSMSQLRESYFRLIS